MVDICHDLARHAEHRIVFEPELELVAPAELTTVVFRYVPRGTRLTPEISDELNGRLRRWLIETGVALIGRTLARGPGDSSSQVCLKLTLLNPTATPRDIDELLDAVLNAGRELSRQVEGPRT